MNAANVNAFIIPHLPNANQNTFVIQVPYAGIGTSCSGGTAPQHACNGKYGAPCNAPTAIIPAFDGSGIFEPELGGMWSHEIGEAMTDSNGEGWWVGTMSTSGTRRPSSTQPGVLCGGPLNGSRGGS